MHAFKKSLRQGVEVLRHANEGVDLTAAAKVVEGLIHCRGSRYFTGVGKSGLAAARMASSLNSIGLVSHWVHGSEWAHGELGSLCEGDIVTAVSHSGTTAEMIWLAEQLKQRRLQAHSAAGQSCGQEGVRLVAFTGNASSALARRASIALTCVVPPGSEALELLPTGSVLVTHHIFNAVMCECAERLGVTRSDVLKYHPGGAVGLAASDHEN